MSWATEPQQTKTKPVFLPIAFNESIRNPTMKVLMKDGSRLLNLLLSKMKMRIQPNQTRHIGKRNLETILICVKRFPLKNLISILQSAKIVRQLVMMASRIFSWKSYQLKQKETCAKSTQTLSELDISRKNGKPHLSGWSQNQIKTPNQQKVTGQSLSCHALEKCLNESSPVDFQNIWKRKRCFPTHRVGFVATEWQQSSYSGYLSNHILVSKSNKLRQLYF